MSRLDLRATAGTDGIVGNYLTPLASMTSHVGVRVWVHPQAQVELRSLSEADCIAVFVVISLLRDLGPDVPEPHSSQLFGSDELHLLCPDSGMSSLRVFWGRYGGGAVVLAIGPSDRIDHAAFQAVCRSAKARLREISL